MDLHLAKKLLNGRSFLSMESKTNLHARIDGVMIRYYSTDILHFKKDGSIVINTHGRQSATTKKRINAYLPKPFAIIQISGSWYWNTGKPFKDGDKIKSGRIVSAYKKCLDI